MDTKKYPAMLLLVAVILLIGGFLFRTVIADQYKGSKSQSYIVVNGEMKPVGNAGVIGGNSAKQKEAVRTGTTLMAIGGISAAAGIGMLLTYRNPRE